MQRAKRRLSCCRASVSSLSNASARMRRGSRTSSAGGDCVAVSQGSNRFAEITDSKIKLRPTKHNAKVTSINFKSPKKSLKTAKTQRPTFGSLQNAVVLAPFYTLKRAYQTKLVDLYSHEKSKKLNNKVKMAKKQNASFEYNVLEVKPPGNTNQSKSTSKREATRKKKIIPTKGKRKRNITSRQKVYCQCDKATFQNIENNEISRETYLNSKATKRNLRDRMINTQLHSENLPKYHMPLTVFDHQVQKKRKLENQILEAPLLKPNIALKYSKSNDNLVGTSQSISNTSLRGDSWETFSDSLSPREERLEGSLIISTTSFDSCFEQSSYDDQESTADKSKQSRYNAHIKMIDDFKRSTGGRITNIPSKSQANEQRFGFANCETRINDPRINDFINQEPLNRGIHCSQRAENMQLLPLMSKTKHKKSETGAASSNSYYLRSSMERPVQKENYISQAERSTQKTLASTSRRFYEDQIMKRILSRNNNVDTNSKEAEKKSSQGVITMPDTQDKQTHFLFQSAGKTVEESYSQTDEIFASLNQCRSDTPGKSYDHEPTSAKEINEGTIQMMLQCNSTNSLNERDKKQENQSNTQSKVEDEKAEEERLNKNLSESEPEYRLPEVPKEPEEMTTTTIMTIDLFPGTQKPVRFQDISH